VSNKVRLTGEYMNKNLKIGLTIAATASFVATGCTPKATEEASVVAGKKLWVTSGQCYSGSGITAYAQTASGNAVSSYDSVSGAFNGVTLKMDAVSPIDVNTTPVDIINRTDDVLVLTENASQQINRRVLKVPKLAPTTYTSFISDGDAFSSAATNIVKAMALDSTDGSIQFSKSLFGEKVTAGNVRVVKGGANPWINPAAITGTCFPAIPAAPGIVDIGLIAPFTAGLDGKTIMLHGGATAATNRILAVQRTGLTSATAADCAGVTAGGLSTVVHTNGPGLAGPVAFNAAGASPTAMVIIPTSTATAYKMIVAYSTPIATLFDNNTTFNTGLVMWDLTEGSDTAVTFTNPVIIYRNTNIVWAPSALAFDSTDNTLYVAVGGAPGVVNQTTSNYGYNIEKFTVDIAAVAPATVLTRVHTDNKPFFIGNENTRCISGLAIE
jgi:hypothetical protein